MVKDVRLRCGGGRLVERMLEDDWWKGCWRMIGGKDVGG